MDFCLLIFLPTAVDTMKQLVEAKTKLKVTEIVPGPKEDTFAASFVNFRHAEVAFDRLKDFEIEVGFFGSLFVSSHSGGRTTGS